MHSIFSNNTEISLPLIALRDRGKMVNITRALHSTISDPKFYAVQILLVDATATGFDNGSSWKYHLKHFRWSNIPQKHFIIIIRLFFHVILLPSLTPFKVNNKITIKTPER